MNTLRGPFGDDDAFYGFLSLRYFRCRRRVQQPCSQLCRAHFGNGSVRKLKQGGMPKNIQVVGIQVIFGTMLHAVGELKVPMFQGGQFVFIYLQELFSVGDGIPVI